MAGTSGRAGPQGVTRKLESESSMTSLMLRPRAEGYRLAKLVLGSGNDDLPRSFDELHGTDEIRNFS